MNDFLQNLRSGQAEKQRPQKTRKNYDNSYHYTNSKFQSYGVYQSSKPQHMKKHPAQPQSGNQAQTADDNLVTSMLAEAIDNLSAHIEIMTKNQDKMINAQVKTAQMLERHVNAVDRILDHLNIAPLPETHSQPTTLPGETGETKSIKKIFENHYVTSSKAKSDKKTSNKVSSKAFKQSSGKTAVKDSKPLIRKRKKIVEKKSVPAVKANNKPCDREKVMEIIHTMRAKGATFDQVASHLIELGEPTFSGRGEWHAQTIHRLCSKK